jgi:hypothetical protein
LGVEREEGPWIGGVGHALGVGRVWVEMAVEGAWLGRMVEVEVERRGREEMLRRGLLPRVLRLEIGGSVGGLCCGCKGRSHRRLHGMSGPLREVREVERFELCQWTFSIWEAAQVGVEGEHREEH